MPGGGGGPGNRPRQQQSPRKPESDWTVQRGQVVSALLLLQEGNPLRLARLRRSLRALVDGPGAAAAAAAPEVAFYNNNKDVLAAFAPEGEQGQLQAGREAEAASAEKRQREDEAEEHRTGLVRRRLERDAKQAALQTDPGPVHRVARGAHSLASLLTVQASQPMPRLGRRRGARRRRTRTGTGKLPPCWILIYG